MDGKRIKYRLITYGCTLNQADSNIMRGVLGAHGCVEVQQEEKADVVVVNSCTVKDATQTKIEHVLRKFANAKKPTVLAGCLSVNEAAVLRSSPNASIVGRGRFTRQCKARLRAGEPYLKGRGTSRTCRAQEAAQSRALRLRRVAFPRALFARPSLRVESCIRIL